MTPTLLLDLDGTLLDNEIGEFLPQYLKALGKHLASHVAPDRLIPTLLTATQEMIQNNRPDLTLKEVFEAKFFSDLNLDREALQTGIDEFYAEIFPGLRSHTSPRPEAITLVEYAVDCGYRIAIATNPLFPRSAILQRLEWANLSPQDYPFSLIASYETFHFAKPNPVFFTEILARLGWPDGGVIMVGDDLYNDIYPARSIGIPTFWVAQDKNIGKDDPFTTTAQGSLGAVIPWLDSASPEQLRPDFSSTIATTGTLRATPAALAVMIHELPASAYNVRAKPDEWSLTEILCHLRDVEQEVNLPRLKKVIDELDPFLPGMVTDPWAEERQYICQDAPTALASFTQSRLQLLNLLDGLKDEDLRRTARHAIFGPTHLKELVGINAGHDRLHLQQVKKTINIIKDQAS